MRLRPGLPFRYQSGGGFWAHVPEYRALEGGALKAGGRCRDRTYGPRRVKAMLYR